MTGLLLRDAELDGRTRADVRIAGGRVTEIAGSLIRRAGEAEHDCHGGALLPGLCDHHLHLFALAAQARSIHCGPALAENVIRPGEGPGVGLSGPRTWWLWPIMSEWSRGRRSRRDDDRLCCYDLPT